MYVAGAKQLASEHPLSVEGNVVMNNVNAAGVKQPPPPAVTQLSADHKTEMETPQRRGRLHTACL